MLLNMTLILFHVSVFFLLLLLYLLEKNNVLSIIVVSLREAKLTRASQTIKSIKSK